MPCSKIYIGWGKTLSICAQFFGSVAIELTRDAKCSLSYLCETSIQPVYHRYCGGIGHRNVARADTHKRAMFLMKPNFCAMMVSLPHAMELPESCNLCNSWPWDSREPTSEPPPEESDGNQAHKDKEEIELEGPEEWFMKHDGKISIVGH